MVDAVESMAYVGNVPWHGLGVPVRELVSIEEMGKAAGLARIPDYLWDRWR